MFFFLAGVIPAVHLELAGLGVLNEAVRNGRYDSRESLSSGVVCPVALSSVPEEENPVIEQLPGGTGKVLAFKQAN